MFRVLCSKTLLLLASIAFLLIVIFGVCLPPASGHHNCCDNLRYINPATDWRDLLSLQAQVIRITTFLLVIFLFSALRFIQAFIFYERRFLCTRKLYSLSVINISFLDFLKKCFREGILNPKIY